MDKSGKRFRLSLSTGILIGVVLGVLSGIFFGEHCAFLQIFGDAFIKLLQMTILPYIIVSLILGIGGLTYDQAKLLVVKAGALLLLFLTISGINSTNGRPYGTSSGKMQEKRVHIFDYGSRQDGGG